MGTMPLKVLSQNLGDRTETPGNDKDALKTRVPRGEFLSPDTFSPVNENGSFEFDRVLKRGKVLRRSRTKRSFKASWKPGYLVLRPNLLSLYKDEDEAQLRLAITLSDISTVAHVKAPRSKRPNVFGIFSPENNYRFQVPSQVEADIWVDLIRSECSVEYSDTFLATDRTRANDGEESNWELSDYDGTKDDVASTDARNALVPVKSNFLEVSGNDFTSCSDFSDTPQPVLRRSTGSACEFERSSLVPTTTLQRQLSAYGDPERVIFNGYLLCLKSKKGVRQWKKFWMVLRAEKLAFYKNEREYSAAKIIPLDQVIDAADVDPISRSKVFCFQLITEEATYRFCAPDEQSLNQWLGSLKSALMRSHEPQRYLMSGLPAPASSSGTR